MTDAKYDAGFAAGMEEAARVAETTALYGRDAAKAIRALTPGDGWCRDMDAAPKNGVGVLLWWPHWWHSAHPGYYLNNQWHSDKALSGGTDDDPNGPVAWRHLPEPPRGTP